MCDTYMIYFGCHTFFIEVVNLSLYFIKIKKSWKIF